MDRVSETIEAIKGQHEDIEVCACLGLLKDGQAERLRAAGADAYNHNLNTSEATYADICTTHDFSDRVETVQQAQAAGLSACSGLIAGMGESDADLVDVVFALRELDPDSVPVNFLIPMEGTPLAGDWHLTPQRCLRILAMTRFICPDAEVRLAAWARGASALVAATGSAPGQLDLPRGLSDQRGTGGPGRPGHDRGRRFRGGGRGDHHAARTP